MRIINTLQELVYDMSENLRLILCRPDRSEIGELNNCIHDRNLHLLLKGISELSFTVPLYVEDRRTHKKIRNKFYDLIKNDYMVCAYNMKTNQKHYFTILNSDCDIEVGLKGEKKVQCYSSEVILTRNEFPPCEGTFQLYKDNNEDTPFKSDGILNFIEGITNWKIGYVSKKAKGDTYVYDENNQQQLERKHRIFSIGTGQNIMQVLTGDIAKSYDVIFLFDTDKEEINVYSTDEIGEDKGFYLSDRKFLRHINKKQDGNNIVTKLHIYGDSNISIEEINPLGTDFIEDLSYYRTDEYMEQDLLEAYDKYDQLLIKNQVIFEDLLKQLNKKECELSDLEKDLIHQKSKVGQAKDTLNFKIHEGITNTKSYNDDLKLEQGKCDNIEQLIKFKNIEIENIQNQINRLSEENKKENNFTKEQLNVIQRLTREGTWNNENYFDKKELFEAGKKAIKIKNKPEITFNITVQDLLKDKRNRDIDKLVLGDKIYLDIKELNNIVCLKMIEFNYHDLNNKSEFSIVVSNFDEKNDINRYFSNGSIQNAKTNNTVSNKKFKWNQAEIANMKINEVINNDLDASKNAVLAGNSQAIRIDGHGAEFKNIHDSNRQLKIINDVIAMTKDNWDTANVAITPEGIVAATLIGRILIGEDLILEHDNNYFKFDSSGIRIKADKFILEGIGHDDSLKAQLELLRNEINLSVKKGDVVSEINMSEGKVKIDADHIELQGFVTMKDLANNGKPTIIDGGLIKTGVLKGIELYGVKITGSDGYFGKVESQSFISRGRSWFHQTVQVQNALEIGGDEHQGYVGCRGNIMIDGGDFGCGNGGIEGKGNGSFAGNLTVGGHKNCMIQTKDYGKVLMNAYEFDEPLLGHKGFGKTDNKGKCFIELSDRIQQVIDTTKPYHFEIQTYDGQVNKIKRFPTYVIVEGTPNIEFSWTLTGRDKRFSNETISNIENREIDKHDNNSKVIESILMKDYISDIEDKLMN